MKAILSMPFQPYTIKIASPEDTEAIARFQVDMARESENLSLDFNTVITGVAHIFGEPERGFYVITQDSRKDIVGSLLVLKEWSDWRNTDVWWVHSVYVLPPHRKRGVFKNMLKHVESLARLSGAAGIRLYVEKTNDNAKKVYARLGLNGNHYELFEKMF